MASTSKTRIGFKVPCPHCGAMDAIKVNVHDLTMECNECNEDVLTSDLQRLIVDAQRLMAWLDVAERM